MNKYVVNETTARSGTRIEWSEWLEMIQRGLEASRSEEWIGKGSRWAEWEGVVEMICMAKKRVKKFERVGKSENVGGERATSSIILCVVG